MNLFNIGSNLHFNIGSNLSIVISNSQQDDCLCSFPAVCQFDCKGIVRSTFILSRVLGDSISGHITRTPRCKQIQQWDRFELATDSFQSATHMVSVSVRLSKRFLCLCPFVASAGLAFEPTVDPRTRS